jgi:hypothetical protein
MTPETVGAVKLFLATLSVGGEHHVTIPNHDPLRVGRLAAILAEVAGHSGSTRD